jgi:TPR repeat protein
MAEVLNAQSLDEKIWSILACSENALDLLHYVRHVQNRDGRHEMALDAAAHYWGNNCHASLMIGVCHTLITQAEAGNTVAMFHLGRWHSLGYKTQWLERDEPYWYEQGRLAGDGRCTTELARLTARSDKPAAIALLHEAIEQGHVPAYCYLADLEPDDHDAHLFTAANSGDPFSMYCYGYHFMGLAQTMEERESYLDWIKRAAVAGESAAGLYLGLLFLYGKDGFDADRETAYEWFRLGARYGNAKCLGALGRELLYASSETADDGKRLLMHSAMLGDLYAQSTLGFHQLWKGQSPEEQTMGVEWLTAAAEQDHKYAIYNVGEAHLRGKGTPQNTPEAVSWYEKGITLGSADCQAAMGYLHFMGRGVPEDEIKAHELFQLASLQGDTWGTYLLGLTYAGGHGVTKDLKVALDCFLQAAEKNDPSSTFKVGRAFLLGEGIEKNKGAAVKWLRQAARLGSSDAHVYLGLMLVYGDGVEENPAEAAKWFRKAAEDNDPRALRELGLLYAEGKGVAKDMAEAQRLMATAASLNDDEAKEWLDEHCPQKPDWLVKLRTGESE